MRYTSTGSGTQRGRRRMIMWLGVFSLLMSLMGPTFTLWAADAEAARGEEQQEECEPGFYYDENAGACVEEPDCPEGQAWDADQAACVEDPNYQPEQDEAPVGIQIEKWDCPAAEPGWGYSEFTSSDCEQSSTPVTFTHGGEGLSEESQTGPGYYEWTDQPFGNHYAYEDIPDGYGTPRVFCVYYFPDQGESPSNPSEVALQNGNAVGWNLEPGQYVYCYWFNILEGYGQIHITKYDCASFTEDPASATWQYLQSECDTWSGDPVEYQLWQGSNQVDSTSTGSGGEASFDQAATGDITVAEVLPEGYTYSIVYCTYYPSDQQNEQDYQPVEVQDGSFHTWTLEPNYVLDCYWFNFYEGTGSTIDFYKYVCAYDTPFDQDYDYYLENCQPREGWDFDVSWDGGGSTETTDSDGKASWTGVPQGDWSGSEDLDDSWGQPHVWCRYVEWPDEAEYDNNWFPFDPSGGQIDRTFEYDGVHIECYWFNFEPTGEYNWVDFYKYTCPYDLYDSGDSWEYYSGECTPTEDWDFDLSWEGGGSTQTTDGSGLASWSEVPAGSWTGSETVPDGWEQPIVYCRYVEWPEDASYSDEWTQWDVTDGAIDWEFEYDSGVRVECYWFNFAPDNYNWIDFYKYTCPYDLYEGGGSWDYYSSECTPLEDWDFDVQWDGGGSTETTGSDGLASWSEVPQGAWTGTESVPDGWEQPYVYCRYVEWPDGVEYSDEWTQYEVTDGSISGEFEYESGVRIECYWFNFAPDNYNWVDFYKYTCPFDYYTGQDFDFDSWTADCEPYGEGWEFDLSWDGGGSTEVTDSDSHASWSGVPAGTWSGLETVPEGWGTPTVWCRYVEWPDDVTDIDGEWFGFEATNGGIGYDNQYDQVRIECYWFNFPTDQYNWVDFYKYSCPYDLYEGGGSWEYYYDECEPVQDWPFDLAWDGGGSTQQTDSSGLASWSGVPQGSWTGSEEVPDGWETPYVYCRYVEWPDDAEYTDEWIQYEVTDGSISGEFEYESGVRIECYWFNFEPEDYNWVDFYKYTCAYDYPIDQDIDSYLEDCEPTEGWDYTLGWDAGGSESKSTGSDGHVSWSGLPTGGWWGQEDLPGGYGDPIVWCRYVEWPEEAGYSGDWESYTVTDGRIEGSFDYDNTRIECYWFNFEPEGGSWIQFYKLWCSEEATYDATFDELLNDYCEYRDDQSADISLTYGGSTSTKSTSGETPAEWQGVPTGEWTVEEAQYDGWGQPIIWCQYVEWPEGVTGYDQEPWQLETNGWQASWTHEDDGLRIACVIFNIPYQENWVEITKWWCSEEVTTPYDREYSDLTTECETYTEGVDFNLEWNGGSESKTTDGEGNAEWGGLPGGDWSLHETVPDGYSDPIVWCYWVEWPAGAEVSEEPYSFQAPHGSFTGSFDWSGMRIHCDIFNIPTYDPGWITVYKWYCAEGIPLDSAPEYLRDECDIVTTGVEFNLEYGDVSVPMTTDASGKAEWTEVPTGGWTLTETVSEGYGTPVIYCQWVEWPESYAGEFTEDLYQPTQEGASVTGTHQYPGLKLVCYWFNFEYDGGDHWVTFYKYYCPPESDYGSDIEQWVENCQTQDGVQFTMTGGTTDVPKTTSGGTAEWTGVADGDYTFTETLPEGYANPVVWCTRYEYTPGQESGNAVELSTYEAATVEEGSWSTSFEGGPWRIYCYWFNIPGDDSTITIYKYNCEYKPSGYSSLWQWQEACTEKGDGITFTLDNSDGSSAKDTADGKVEWTGVPNGEFTVTEEPVAGYGDAVIWCGWTAYYNGAVYDAFPSLYEGQPNIVEGEISYPGTTWFCWWFNIPEEHSKIVIYKFNCPDGVNLNGDLEDYKYTCKEYGDGVDFTLENSSGSSTKTITDGSASWYDLPGGDFTLTETVPEGYGEAVWWCGWTGYDGGAVYDGFPSRVEAPGGVYEGSIDYDVTYYFCWVFNFPDYDREITVYKWWCPPDWSPESESYEDWKEACSTPIHGVGFELSWDGGSSWKGTNGSGRASWYGYEPGEYTLTEQYLPGYESPYVFCSLEAYYEDGAAYAENYTWYDVTDRSVSKDVGEYQEYKWICHFFNIEKGPGDITVYKWNCPPGYDPYAWNADPTKDCTQARNDVDFVLDQPSGPNVTRTTGDDGEGTVFFGDLPPGNYVVTEKVPSDTEFVFIWDCYGGDIPAVHPNPLQVGNTLNVKVAGGDHIVCYWYNVPYPQDGWVTLYKYQCWTTTYTSDVDCEIYEFGASFELTAAEGGESKGTGTTNAGGTYTWSGLDEGAYDLEEISHQPCKITSTKVSENGEVWVDAGQETIVKVYNCSPPDGTPTPGGKVPTKYPNTGVGDSGDVPVVLPQDDGDDEEASDDEDTQVIEPDDEDAEGTPTAQEAASEFYTIACIEGGDEGTGDGDGSGNGDGEGNGEGTGEGNGAGDGSGNQDEEDNELPPFLQGTSSDEPDEPTGDEATEEPTDDGSDEDQAATTDEECVRGALPQQLVIDAADVNYPVEYLEILDGVMEAPTGPQFVSWYKETARLGEQNNIVIAAHVNWWNVPEGPFYHLADLQEGDRIEITGDDGKVYVFEVQWVRQESNLDAPNPEVVGPTGEATLTLITCGGEWDPAISEYNERTVVRAIQVDVIDTGATTDDGEATPASEEDGQSSPAPIAFIRSIWTERIAA